MATTNWNRVVYTSGSYASGFGGQDSINPGSSYRRVRWSWGFTGVTADTVDVNALMSNIMVAGIVTTIGNGTETPPNPALAPFDAAPPTQRWLWWEARQPIPIAVDHAAGIITWRDSGPQEIPDVQVNVLATGIPTGQRLNIWFSYGSLFNTGWDPLGSFRIWTATSVLSTTP
jgi:hypothetical protein